MLSELGDSGFSGFNAVLQPSLVEGVEFRQGNAVVIIFGCLSLPDVGREVL